MNKSAFMLKSMGLHQFKNIREPMEVFAIANTGLVIPEKKTLQRRSARVYGGLGNVAWVIFTALILGTISYMIWHKKSVNDNLTVPFTLKPLNVSSWFEGWESWSPDGDMYAYASLESGDGDLYIRNINGGKPVQITDTPYDEYLARWSPDGRSIAYVSIRNGQCNIYTIPPMGGSERLLTATNIPGIEQNITTFFCLGESPWSLDGSKLLFSAMDNDRTIAVWQVDVTTGLKKQMTFPPNGSQDLMGSWSHDKQKIIFTRNQRLYLKDLASDEISAIISEPHQASMPLFNANDTKIIFSLSRAGDQNIWDYDLVTHNLRQITHLNKRAWGACLIPNNGGLSVDEFSHQIDIIQLHLDDQTEKQLSFYHGDNSYGRFSPDARHIVYQSDRTGNLEIWMLSMDADHSETNLTSHPATDFKPDWSPDGSRIAFFSNRDGPYQVWLMNSSGLALQKAGNEPIELGTSLIKTVHQVKWSPEGEKIGYLALGSGGPSLWIIDLQSDQSHVALPGVNSFTWYRNDDMIIYHRQNTDSLDQSQLVAINLKTGLQKILLQNVSLTELFIDKKYHWLGFTSATGHFSYALHRVALDSIADEQGFPSISQPPEELANGAGKWHVHNGCFSPDGKSVIYSRDADQMDIYLVDGYR